MSEINKDGPGTTGGKDPMAGAPDDVRAAVRHRLAYTDELLEFLVTLAEDKGFGFPITVSAGGVTVTGSLIGTKRYYELQTEASLLGQNEDVQADVRATFQGMAGRFESRPALPYEYLHLANARYLNGGALFPLSDADPFLWRCKCVAVDGFCLNGFQETA